MDECGRDFLETMDQKTDMIKLWRTIEGIGDRAKHEAQNEAIKKNYTLCSVHVFAKKYICSNTFLETELWLTAAGIQTPCII